ncbi:hypothetical protein BT69DRAFT_1290876 [Atractiella rhizophila]|nr:hypothetical protein BT69DRAFT_1290876 [Atractiella rhizophila]
MAYSRSARLRIMTSAPICLKILPQKPQQYAVEDAEEVSAKGGKVLYKIIYGAVKRDEGDMEVDEEDGLLGVKVCPLFEL